MSGRVRALIAPSARDARCYTSMGVSPVGAEWVERVQELADGEFGSAIGDARPPPATEKEEECIRRAMKKLSEHIPLLCGLLGQQMPAPVGMDIGSFWRALRKLGSTGEILLRLALDFKPRVFPAAWQVA